LWYIARDLGIVSTLGEDKIIQRFRELEQRNGELFFGPGRRGGKWIVMSLISINIRGLEGEIKWKYL